MASTIWKRWMRAWTLVFAACMASAVLAQNAGDPPGRVARLSQPDTTAMVEWAPAGTNDWQAAQANWPFTTGDRLRVPAGGRAELHAGDAALRLQGPAQLDIAELDDDTLRVTLTEGSLNLNVRSLGAGERIEVGTGNLALVVNQPGEMRLDAEPATDSTRVLLRAGAATVYGENGESQALQPQQQLRYAGRRLNAIAAQGAGPRDALDQWAADRQRDEDQSISARYLPREAIGYQELDTHGEWASDASYGTVWYPRITVQNWAPYRYGQWRWIAPWGWTWVDDAPWGFTPFHYGRWVQLGPRWAWVPGPMGRRPVYSPALVGFEGAPGPRPGFGRPQHPGSPWFPLAPGEAWRPAFGGSPRYLDRINRGLPPPPPRFAFQGRPEAISSAPLRDPRWRERDRPSMPGPQFGPPGPGPSFRPPGPGPSFQPPGPGPSFRDPARSIAEQEQRARQQQDEMQQRERWQRQQQQDRERRIQDEARGGLQAQEERVRREQMQREWAERRQQREAQEQQGRQQRDMQERQQRQMQEQREHQQRQFNEQRENQQRQMNEQRERQQRQMQEQRDQQQRFQRQIQSDDGQRRPQPPRTAIQERPGDPGQRGGRN